MRIYLVIVNDRHLDLEVLPFTSLEPAFAAAEKEMLNLAAHHDSIEWGDKKTEETVGEDGEYWYIGYEPESDYVRVIGRDVENEQA